MSRHTYRLQLGADHAPFVVTCKRRDCPGIVAAPNYEACVETGATEHAFQGPTRADAIARAHTWIDKRITDDGETDDGE